MYKKLNYDISYFDTGGYYSYAKKFISMVEGEAEKEAMEDDLRKCPSGAVRDCSEGKGRMDLLPGHALLKLQQIVGEDVHWPDATMELAKVFEKGAEHYAARNWEQGMYVDWFIDSGQRHLEKALAGWDDEPHLFMALWNLTCLVDTLERIHKGKLDKEYLGDFVSLGERAESYPTIGLTSMLSYDINSLLCRVKHNIYKILAGGGAEYASYANAFLFEVADRFAKAVREDKPKNLGALQLLYNKRGACG